MQNMQVHQLCFALWKDGYYYPAIISEVLPNHAKVALLDGSSGITSKDHVVELAEAFETMEFEGKFRNWWFFYKGKITSHNPMIMHYYDGDVEQIELRQLRGIRRGN